MTELVLYDAMCSAITECHAVDEVLTIKDKARALEVYAAQVRNIDAERKACAVRLRAERRVGELLKELTRATASEAGAAGGHAKAGTPNHAERQTPYTRALADNAISTQSASRYQRLADVPHEEFELALADPVAKPSTTRLIQQAREPTPTIDDDALWIWGRARDFERMAITPLDAPRLLAAMTPTMRADMRRIAPDLADFFNVMLEGTQ